MKKTKMVFGGPHILDCYLHTAKPTKIYTPETCCHHQEQKEKLEKKEAQKKKVQVKITRPPAKKSKKEAEPLPIAQPNLRKRPGRPKKQ